MMMNYKKDLKKENYLKVKEKVKIKMRIHLNQNNQKKVYGFKNLKKLKITQEES